MVQVTVTINGRGYQIACDEGQQQHLANLAADLDRRVGELTHAMGQIGDTRLLVMVGLLLADELAETQANLEAERAKAASLPPEVEETLAGGIEMLAQRIEDIAARLEAT